MSEQEIKPCPFCGNCALSRSSNGVSNYFVVCDECGSEGPAKQRIDLSITAWNTRAQAQLVSAQPAGEVPEVDFEAYIVRQMDFRISDKTLEAARSAWDAAVTALQARTVVMPERLKTQPFTTIDRGSKDYKAGWNGCLNEFARLNGKGGV